MEMKENNAAGLYSHSAVVLFVGVAVVGLVVVVGVVVANTMKSMHRHMYIS